jgi:hypothetical protein
LQTYEKCGTRAIREVERKKKKSRERDSIPLRTHHGAQAIQRTTHTLSPSPSPSPLPILLQSSPLLLTPAFFPPLHVLLATDQPSDISPPARLAAVSSSAFALHPFQGEPHPFCPHTHIYIAKSSSSLSFLSALASLAGRVENAGGCDAARSNGWRRTTPLTTPSLCKSFKIFLMYEEGGG